MANPRTIATGLGLVVLTGITAHLLKDSFISPSILQINSPAHTEKIVRSLPEANGYDVRMNRSNKLAGYTEIFVNGGQFKDYNGYLYARDNESDGRFDEIKLVDVPKGSELEQFATIDKVAEIARAVGGTKSNLVFYQTPQGKPKSEFHGW